jgi:thiol-disulfide isomerase/thioredoxin
MKQDGRAAPPLVLRDQGNTIDLRDFRGQWVMVHFWASWCGPCRMELPTLQAVQHAVDSKQLKLLMVNTAESEENIFIFLSSVAPDLESYRDVDGSITEYWQPRGLPASFFVDPDGKMRYLALGGRPWNEKRYLDFVKGLHAR